jgi:hypothetical protein
VGFTPDEVQRVRSLGFPGAYSLAKNVTDEITLRFGIDLIALIPHSGSHGVNVIKTAIATKMAGYLYDRACRQRWDRINIWMSYGQWEVYP